MFDRCRNWRRELSHRADGTLPLARWGALEQHLTRCGSCRSAAQADEALRDVLSRHTGSLGAETGEAFDNRVVAALLAQSSTGAREPAGKPRSIPGIRQVINVEFFGQMMGGAIAAASITALCFYPALHITAPSADRSLRSSSVPRDYNSPPVTIESLLSNPAPRAALLWSPPASRHPVRPVGIFEMAPRLTDITSPARAPRRAPQQHGSVLRTTQLS